MTALNELEVSKSSLWRAGLPAVFLGWVWARLCIASGFLTAHLLVDQLETPRGSEQIQQGLFTWDGAFYRGLAQQWYTRPLGGAAGSLAGEEARFFPVYPALAKALGPLLGGHADWALIAISNIAAFLGAWVLWKLATEVLQGQDQDQDQGEAASTLRRSSKGRSVEGRSVEGRSVADRSAVLIAIFPAAFVLAFAYSEGLALLVVAGTLLALQRRNFVMAGLLALLAAAIRPVGGLLLVPIAIELLRAQPRPRWWNWIIGLGGPFLGFGLALIWIERSTGELLLPLRLQRQIRGGFQDPLTRVLEPVGELIRGNFRDVYNLGFMVVFLSLFVFMLLGARRSGPKLPTSWIAYSGVSLLLMLSSQVTDSLGRYGLLVVPFIVALAMWADRRWRMIAVGIACSAGLIWLTSEALLGRLVP